MTLVDTSKIAKDYWRKIPKAQRSALVPRNGGRPRKYPVCPRYKAHRFSPVTGRCPCGFSRPD